MKRCANIFVFFALTGILSVPSAEAEYCWMVGCKGREGFILTYTLKEGRKQLAFRGSALPPAGSEATIAHFLSMSDSPPSRIEEGSYNLGPGFVVKVLEYVGTNKEVAHIKIISDDLEK